MPSRIRTYPDFPPKVSSKLTTPHPPCAIILRRPPSPSQSHPIQSPIAHPKIDRPSISHRLSTGENRLYPTRQSRYASRSQFAKGGLRIACLISQPNSRWPFRGPKTNNPALSVAYLLWRRACEASPRLARARKQAPRRQTWWGVTQRGRDERSRIPPATEFSQYRDGWTGASNRR